MQVNKFDSLYLQIHFVGNKLYNDGIRLSKSELKVNENIAGLLMTYFLSPFKSEGYYNLYHESDLRLNEVFTYAATILAEPDCLHEQSINLAKHLYEQSTHPKIKGGEFYVVYFKDCIVDGITTDAVGLFKSETKDTFLKVFQQQDGFSIESDSGININKLDKGCIIFNTEKENGYIVSVVDNTSKGSEAQYWFDHFLHVRPRNDGFYQTKNTLSLAKDFVVNKLPEQFDITKADQAELLNRSVKFFKERDSFEMDEFANEVLAEPEVINSFKTFRSQFEQERDIELNDSFMISDAAVKKQARVLKSVIKLDKNFHIYVHGDHNKIVKGYDEATGMHYYQLFFREES